MPMKNPNALVSSDHGPIIINLNDAYIGSSIVQSGYWAQRDIQLMFQILNLLYQRKPRLLVYDVGANIGTHTLALARGFGERIVVRAFEAQRQIHYMLCGTVALNGLRNVWCHNLAVGERTGERLRVRMPDYDAPNNFGGVELMPARLSDNHEMNWAHEEWVDTVALDAFGEQVDCIKMDVEGMEDRALRGAVATIRDGRPVCFVETQKSDAAFIADFFKGLGYEGYANGPDLLALPAEFQFRLQGAERRF